MGVCIRSVAIAAYAACLMSTLLSASAVAFSHDQNLDDFTNEVDAVSARIEASAEASQSAGDADLAQRQFLIREMMKRAAGEIRFLKTAALRSPIRDLASAQIREIDGLAELMANIDYSDKSKIAATTAATQSRIGALVDAMAEGRAYPIMYGMLARDLMDKPDAAAADIEVFGHNIIDPALRKDPTARVGGADIPPSMVKMKGDNILIDIPDGTKDRIGFAPTACQPRNTFPVRVTALHGAPHGVWPIRWVTKLESNSDFTALPSPRIYEFSLSYNYQWHENMMSTESYSNRSNFVVAACGQTIETSVRYEAPAGAHDLSCKVSWAEATGQKSATKSCQVDGLVADANGALTGPDLFCSPQRVCGCILNARGWLQIDGAYKKDNITIASKTVSPPNKYTVLANASTSVPLETPSGSILKHVGILVNRRSCPTVYARLDVLFSDDGRQIIGGVSKGGAFRASYGDNEVTVVNSTTESSDASDTSN